MDMTWAGLREASLSDAAETDNFALICEQLKILPGDDDRIVFQCYCAAYDYYIRGVGKYYESNALALITLLAITQDFYDNRQLMEQPKKSMRSTIRSAMSQLRLDIELEEEEGVEDEQDQEH